MKREQLSDENQSTFWTRIGAALEAAEETEPQQIWRVIAEMKTDLHRAKTQIDRLENLAAATHCGAVTDKSETCEHSA